MQLRVRRSRDLVGKRLRRNRRDAYRNQQREKQKAGDVHETLLLGELYALTVWRVQKRFLSRDGAHACNRVRGRGRPHSHNLPARCKIMDYSLPHYPYI